LDDKYLRKRGISLENGDPLNLSVHGLKELIWLEWRQGERFDPGANNPTLLMHCNLDRLGTSSGISIFYPADTFWKIFGREITVKRYYFG